MEYNQRYQVRGSHPRMSRGTGHYQHQAQPPRMTSLAWSGNNYHMQDEPRQQPQLDYTSYSHQSYPHSLPSTDQAQFQYAQVQSSCFIQSNPAWPEPNPMFINSTTPTINSNPPLVASKKMQLNIRDTTFKCSNCLQTNSLLQSEFFKKDNTISILTQQNTALKQETEILQETIEKLQQELKILNSPRTSESTLESAGEFPVAGKPLKLSPEAKDFIPKKAESVHHYTGTSATSPPAFEDVPVVSARGVIDESVTDLQIDEEFNKTESVSPPNSISGHSVEMIEPSQPGNNPVEKLQMLEKAMDVEISLSPDHEAQQQEATEMEGVQPDSSSNIANPEMASVEWIEEDLLKSKNPEPDTNTQKENRMNMTGEPQPYGEQRNITQCGQQRTNRRKPNDHHSGNQQHSMRGKGNRISQDGYSERQQTHQGKSFNDKWNHADSHPKNKNQPKNRNNQYSKYSDDSCQREAYSRETNDNRDGHGSPFDKEGLARDTSKENNRGGSARRWEQEQKQCRDGNRSRPDDDGRPSSQVRHIGMENSNGPNRFQDQKYTDKTDTSNKDYNLNNGGLNNNRKRQQKNIVNEIRADLFTAPADVSLAHCVARDFRMGSGIAVKFKSDFKRVSELMDQHVSVGGCAHLKDNNRYIFYLVTKEVSNGKPNYESVNMSLKSMRDLCSQFAVTKLAMPRIGCGLDKLDWNKVKRCINDVFQDSDVQITVYDFNDEGLSEAEGNRPQQSGVHVKSLVMDLLTIEPQTGLLFLGTEDGHMDSAASHINTKYTFITDYKKSPKNVGQIWCKEHSNEYYIYSLIIAKTAKDKVLFTDVENCCRELCKRLRKDEFQFVGLQVAVEWDSDKLFTEKIVTLLRNTLPRSVRELWVCYKNPDEMPGKQAAVPPKHFRSQYQ